VHYGNGQVGVGVDLGFLELDVKVKDTEAAEAALSTFGL
jgi:hypothetical protein